jgi:hypothetical protein
MLCTKESHRWSQNCRVGASFMYLTCYADEGEQFLQYIVTGNETCVNQLTPETQKASMTWKHPSYPRTKKLKAAPSVRKIMPTAFSDHKSVLLVDFLDHCNTNCWVLLWCLRGYCRPFVTRRGVLRHGVIILPGQLDLRQGWEVPILQPLISVSGPHEKHLAGKRFVTDADVKQVVSSWLQTLNADLFYAGIQTMVSRWDICLEVSGDDVDAWCVPFATHAPCIQQTQNNVLGSRVFVTLLLLLLKFKPVLVWMSVLCAHAFVNRSCIRGNISWLITI